MLNISTDKYGFIDEQVRTNKEYFREQLTEAISQSVVLSYPQQFELTAKITPNYTFIMNLIPDQEHFVEALNWLLTGTNGNPPALRAVWNQMDQPDEYTPQYNITQQLKNIFANNRRLLELEDVNSISETLINSDKLLMAKMYIRFQLKQIIDSIE